MAFFIPPQIMEFFIYILYSPKADKYYIGQTSEVYRRLEEHNNPEVFAKFSAKFIPWTLKAVFKISESRSEAIRVEKFIKKQKSRIFIEKLIAQKDDQQFIQQIIRKAISQ
ncbi:GIY-YIG nuclease family protein [Marinilabilia sp.]